MRPNLSASSLSVGNDGIPTLNLGFIPYTTLAQLVPFRLQSGNGFGIGLSFPLGDSASNEDGERILKEWDFVTVYSDLV